MPSSATTAPDRGTREVIERRGLAGDAEPRLPEFLRLIEASSRRALDFIAAFQDPASLPSAREKWSHLSRMRQAAYEESWSLAVLRALELEQYARVDDGEARLASVLGIDVVQLEHALAVLERTGQMAKVNRQWVPLPATAVTTGGDPTTRGLLTRAWINVAAERLEKALPGISATACLPRVARICGGSASYTWNICAKCSPSSRVRHRTNASGSCAYSSSI